MTYKNSRKSIFNLYLNQYQYANSKLINKKNTKKGKKNNYEMTCICENNNVKFLYNS